MASTAASDRAKRGQRRPAPEGETSSALHSAIFQDGSGVNEVPAPRPAAVDERPSEVKPVRVTTDLAKSRYRAMNRMLAEFADELGVATVPGQIVREQLVALLLTDKRTRLMIRAACAKELGVPTPADD